ncbi:MAG: helix-turn-helix transcriptional regulator [Candidatus Anaerobiospirillum pullicola]|uniref:Helix-turn-helix transcriptional regulator n=1 Tax=Candidatus Anaerobiospirillum pullicola TaxID=2838451 RepID=A0A948THS9_9GAMM|nr:helix-turn-helix transcriptional regulator [Candidatus Anaerobiospirillum pullicola]
MANTQSPSVAISTTSKPLPLCPVETTLQMIRSRWAVLILRDLFSGTKRFSDLKRSLQGISQKVLTAELREMEQSNLVERKVYPEVPPRVEYSLTPTGQSLKIVLCAMVEWGLSYQDSHGLPRTAEQKQQIREALHLVLENEDSVSA